jgi:hypothetical protein
MGNFQKLIVLLAAFSGVPLATAEVSEIVTIASRQNTERAEVLASTAVVDQDDLELLSHAHIQQPLSRLAGVNLKSRQWSGIPAGDSLASIDRCWCLWRIFNGRGWHSAACCWLL